MRGLRGGCPEPKPNGPDSLRLERRVKPLARLLRCATALRVTAPLGCGSRRLVWPKEWMAQAMEVVVRFLADEAVSFLTGYAVSLFLGFLGGWAYYCYRLWKLRRYAPSATVTTASVALSQQDYDRLKKEGKLVLNTQYSIVER